MRHCFRFGLFSLTAAIALVGPASACEIAGTWSGPQAYQGAMASQGTRTLTVRIRPDCTYDWGGDRGPPRTAGRATQGWSAGSYSYRNDAGSIGTMTISAQGGRRIMDIVQSQGNYTAQLIRR